MPGIAWDYKPTVVAPDFEEPPPEPPPAVPTPRSAGGGGSTSWETVAPPSPSQPVPMPVYRQQAPSAPQIVTPQGIYDEGVGGGSTGWDQPPTSFLPDFLRPLAREEAKRRMLPFAQQGIPSIGEPLLEGLGVPEGPGIQTPLGRLTARGVAGAGVDPLNLFPLGPTTGPLARAAGRGLETAAAAGQQALAAGGRAARGAVEQAVPAVRSLAIAEEAFLDPSARALRRGPTPTPPAVVPAGDAAAAVEGLTDPILKLPIHRKIVDAADELFRTARIPRDPNRLLSDQILDFMKEERLSIPELEGVLAKHNLTFSELGQTLFRPAVGDAARRLQALSALQHRLNALARTSPEAAAEMGRLRELSAGLDAVTEIGWWRRLDNVRRGLMVSQLATAARNFATQQLRLGLDVVDQGLQASLQKVTGSSVTADPFEGIEAIGRLFSRANRRQVEAVLEAFPAQGDRAFFSYSSDVLARRGTAAMGDKVMGKAEDAVHLLNTVNRFQEFQTRRAVIGAVLDRQLRRAGTTLEAVVQSGDLSRIQLDDVRQAVDKALELTWGRPGPKVGEFGHNLFRAFQNPVGSAVIPFPRFMVESLRFYTDFSPVGLLKFLSKAEWAKVAAGDVKTISRAVIGTGMIGAGYLLRESDLAGERWYEIKTPDGRSIDLRAYAPFAAYLFAGDLVKRFRDGTLQFNRALGSDIAKTLVGTNFRAGIGSELLDRWVNDLLHADFATIGKAAGEYAATFLTPLQGVNDLIGQIDEDHRIVRNRDMEPFFGSLKERIPGLRTTLPPAQSPTAAGPLMREETGLRQLTGVTVGKEKNPAERELDRLLFTRGEILPSTGNTEADNLIAKYLGPLVESSLSRYVQTSSYQALSDTKKSARLRERLIELRAQARDRAKGNNPKLFAQVAKERKPLREQLGGEPLPTLPTLPASPSLTYPTYSLPYP